MFPEWTWIVGFWIGAAIGSFLNVVVYRMPRGKPLSEPAHSFCPSCEHRLTLPDLVPLLSWLFLRGRCRHCGAKVSSRYFFVELINASLWGLIWHQQLVAGEDPVGAIVLALFVSALVAAIFTDLAHYIIPDQINAFMLFLGLAYGAFLLWRGDPAAWTWGMPTPVAGALAGVGVLWGIAFIGRVAFGKDAMGHGDIKMARGIGAVLGPAMALASFGLAVVLGGLFGAAILVGRTLGRKRSQAEETDGREEEPIPEPEPVRSLLFWAFGYVACLDVWGLFFPKWFERKFGENPYSFEDFEEEPRVQFTEIPFGPYLAAGAVAAALAEGPLTRLWGAYLSAMGLG